MPIAELARGLSLNSGFKGMEGGEVEGLEGGAGFDVDLTARFRGREAVEGEMRRSFLYSRRLAWLT